MMSPLHPLAVPGVTRDECGTRDDDQEDDAGRKGFSSSAKSL